MQVSKNERSEKELRTGKIAIHHRQDCIESGICREEKYKNEHIQTKTQKKKKILKVCVKLLLCCSSHCFKNNLNEIKQTNFDFST